MITEQDIDDDVVGYLHRREPIKALVGTAIYPNEVPPEQDLPYVVYQRIGTERPHHLNASAGFAGATMQFDIYGRNRGRARQISEAIRMAMDGYKQGTMLEIDVRWIEQTDARDDLIPPALGEGQGIYNISTDYTVWYAETAPTFPAA